MAAAVRRARYVAERRGRGVVVVHHASFAPFGLQARGTPRRRLFQVRSRVVMQVISVLTPRCMLPQVANHRHLAVHHAQRSRGVLSGMRPLAHATFASVGH